MIDRKLTTIAVSLDVYAQLKKLGQTGDSFTKVVSRLIAEHGSNVIKEEVLGPEPTRPAPHGTNGATQGVNLNDYRDRITK